MSRAEGESCKLLHTHSLGLYLFPHSPLCCISHAPIHHTHTTQGVYASLLAQLAAARQSKPQQAACASAVLRCAVGQVFDSGPVDFSSDVVRACCPGWGCRGGDGVCVCGGVLVAVGGGKC